MTIIARKTNWRFANVAVTGINARTENPGPGMAVARCIRECPEFRGRVIGLGYDALDAGLYARELCAASFLIPYPSLGEKALLARILQIHEQMGLDVIIPCLDAEIPNFNRIKPALAKLGIKMLIPSRDQFNLRAKDHLSAFCKSIDVNVPESKIVSDPSFFDTCEADGWQYPLVVKGIFYDAGIAYSPYDAKTIFGRLVSQWGYPALVQKMVYGDEFDLTAVGDGKGNLLAPLMMRKRALTDKGKAWAGVTVLDQGIEEMANKIVKALMWCGPLEVEVMKTDDGKIYLIEINPRFPSWIYLSHAAGRNLPVTVLKLLDNECNFDFPPAKTGKFFIRHAQELIVELIDFESVLITGSLAEIPERWIQEGSGYAEHV
jgi:carbamoyl-phosphate synthase large subunit